MSSDVSVGPRKSGSKTWQKALSRDTIGESRPVRKSIARKEVKRCDRAKRPPAPSQKRCEYITKGGQKGKQAFRKSVCRPTVKGVNRSSGEEAGKEVL